MSLFQGRPLREVPLYNIGDVVDYFKMLLDSCSLPLRLRSIRREILRGEDATAEKEREKLEAEQKAVFETKRLSKYQYPPSLPPSTQLPLLSNKEWSCRDHDSEFGLVPQLVMAKE